MLYHMMPDAICNPYFSVQACPHRNVEKILEAISRQVKNLLGDKVGTNVIKKRNLRQRIKKVKEEGLHANVIAN